MTANLSNISSPKSVLELLPTILRDATENADHSWDFIDIGCGSGNILLRAFNTPHFKRLIGIESHNYTAIRATKNVEPLGESVKIVECDFVETFSDFDVSAPVCVYLYEPLYREPKHIQREKYQRFFDRLILSVGMLTPVSVVSTSHANFETMNKILVDLGFKLLVQQYDTETSTKLAPVKINTWIRN
jgi:SAM-dependent methyltransferase